MLTPDDQAPADEAAPPLDPAPDPPTRRGTAEAR